MIAIKKTIYIGHKIEDMKYFNNKAKDVAFEKLSRVKIQALKLVLKK
jgi:hypothetical protein